MSNYQIFKMSDTREMLLYLLIFPRKIYDTLITYFLYHSAIYNWRLQVKLIKYSSRAMAQAVSHRPLTA